MFTMINYRGVLYSKGTTCKPKSIDLYVAVV